MRLAEVRLQDELDAANARIAELECVINRVAAQVGHPPIASGEVGLESVAEAVERRMAYARDREETLDSITPENLRAFAASEVHHDEHHKREAELESRPCPHVVASGESRYCALAEDRVRELEAQLAAAKDWEKSVRDADDFLDRHEAPITTKAGSRLTVAGRMQFLLWRLEAQLVEARAALEQYANDRKQPREAK